MKHRVLILLAAVVMLPAFNVAFAGVDDEVAEHAVNPVTGLFELGFEGHSVDKNPARAAEYRYVEENGLTAALDLTGDLEGEHFFLDLGYTNEKDYTVDAHFDYHGKVILTVTGQSLYHNLEHLDMSDERDAWRYRTVTGQSYGINFVDFNDKNPDDTYAVQVEQYGAHLRAKLGDYPGHVNVKYWRLEKSGQKQLRYVDHAGWIPSTTPGAAISTNCNSCHVRSQTREVNRVVEEFKLSADAHAGSLNYELEGLYRQFDDNEPIPYDSFGNWGTGGSHRAAADGPGQGYQHDEDPESQLIAGTARVSTSYAGGLNGALAFTMARRENKSQLFDVFAFGGGELESVTDYYKASGDFTWMPSATWTMNLRYRMLDVDNTNTEQIDVTNIYGDSADYDNATVRDNPDFVRHWSNAKLAFRPSKKLTTYVEYTRQDVKREHTGSPADFVGQAINAYKDLEVWNLPEDETVSRYKVGFFARPTGLSNHKVNGWYQYKTVDNPAYGTTLTEAHEGLISAYMTKPNWGLGLNLHALSGENDDYQRPFFTDLSFPTDDEILGMTDIQRALDQQDAGVSCWVSPANGVNLSLDYAYFHTAIEQDLQFGAFETSGFGPIENEDVEYDQTAHTVTLAATWMPTEPLTLRASGSYSASKAYFDPDFATINAWPYSGFTADVDSSLLKELSKIDIRRTSAKAGIDYRIGAGWSCALNYAFDLYDDRMEELFDGHVHTYMASLAHSW